MGFMPKRILADPIRYDGPHDPIHGPRLLEDDTVPLSDFWCQIEEPHEHADERMWSSKQLFYWRTYDAATFDEWTTYRKERLKPMARQLHWRPGHVAGLAYDTFDAVLSLGSVTDHGTCMECDGNRQRKQCSCPDYVESRKRVRDASGASSGRRRRDVEVSPTVLIPETDETPAVLVDMSTA